MSEDFSTKFIKIVKQIEDNLPNEFQKQHMINYDGKISPLCASFSLNEEKKWLGMLSTGKTTHCHEYRLVYSEPQLDVNKLKNWWDFLCNQQKKLIPVDSFHEFSLVSLILICGSADDESLKTLKKLDNRLQYNQINQNGWSNARLAVINLEKNKIYASKSGDSLVSTLKNIDIS